MRTIRLAGLAGVLMLVAAQANASPLTVNATDSVYGAANSGNGATDPVSVTLNAATTSLTFTGVTGSITNGCVSTEGCITINHGSGDTLNNPDGVGAANNFSGTGNGSLSGIKTSGAGALVGVFVAGTPSGTAPATLDFSGSGATSFTSLSPLLDQVFFIGDGLTGPGDGTGSKQQFNVPSGATTLYLGLADACGYSGSPSCYGDNLGSYTVTVNQAPVTRTVPEPASFATLAVGMLGLMGVARTQRNRA